MPLSFLTKSQQFVFVDPSATPPASINPEAALPNHLYDVYVVVQNTDSFEYTNVQVNVSHSAFGIGNMPGTSGLTQPAPVTVPPEAFGIPGTATVAFTFLTPAGGHGCLGATIAPNGPSIGQNVTVISCPSGVPSLLSFVVFGGATAESMVLTLTESVQNGAVIPPGSPQSWKPLLIAPPGTGPAGPVVSPLTVNLAPEDFYSVGLQVTPVAAAAAHVFTIVGTVAGQFVGEVSIIVNPVAGLPAPDPYVFGGYHSPDVLLFDSFGNPIPIVGDPQGNSLLTPNTDYKISAIVHNDSPTPAVNTVVRFWQLPGGVGSVGPMIDVRTVTVPANGSVQVDSNFPFHSAPPGQHRCAVVSIYNSQSKNATVDAVTSTQIPNPGNPGTHEASAWRNTDSMFVFIGRPWTFALQGTVLPGDPVEVTAAANLVAAGFEKTPEVAALRESLEQAGAQTVYPLFLTPALQAKLPAADLKIKVGAAKPVPVDKTDKKAAATAEFVISGVVPANAKPGDVFLVQVSAKYANKTVQFLESLHVKAK